MSLALVAISLLHAASIHGQDSVFVQKVTGENPYVPLELRAGVPIEFQFRFSNQSAGSLEYFTIGYELSSPDGATWEELTFSRNEPVFSLYDGYRFVGYSNLYGSFTDTIKTAGATFFQPGAPPGFDDWIYSFHTELPESAIGKSVCIDSSFFPPGGTWEWGLDGGNYLAPEWDGPHCYTVVPCCVGLRGNADNSETDMPMSITDLDRIINWLFSGGPAPPCMEEGTADGINSIDIADVSYIVEYFWLDGPEPPPCP